VWGPRAGLDSVEKRNKILLGIEPLSSRLLSKNVKIGIYKALIFPVVLYGGETWSLTLMECL
jgi:hypothetical protein